MNILSRLSAFFGFAEPRGKVVYYRTKSKKWRWKVVNENGNTVVNPIRSYHTQAEAEQSFCDVQDVMDSIPSF